MGNQVSKVVRILGLYSTGQAANLLRVKASKKLNQMNRLNFFQKKNCGSSEVTQDFLSFCVARSWFTQFAV